MVRISWKPSSRRCSTSSVQLILANDLMMIDEAMFDSEDSLYEVDGFVRLALEMDGQDAEAVQSEQEVDALIRRRLKGGSFIGTLRLRRVGLTCGGRFR